MINQYKLKIDYISLLLNELACYQCNLSAYIVSTIEPPLSGQPRSEGARILEFARISEITIKSIA